MIGQVVSLAGAMMILVAYALQQAGKWRSEDLAYLTLNLVGSGILSWFAVEARNLGLIALEGSWALISAWSLAKCLRAPGPASPPR